ncbi:YiiX/YebB-like N1pC/P60 family cysteine hydrolase [Nitrosococcus wardiae]|uniref:Lipo-like protein n=1 Tax=Nitrosococcus wardiae TaxID=1814290 RepID=A0A4P7BX77_9GAMM|nr:YiiX/YebB-like N1pC/P60 family cysteine hydrolase [Nitrosococcus wardiae]QBQ54738.1 hypothetical protein E3U44_09620 [Nitrosococcus wardiae]
MGNLKQWLIDKVTGWLVKEIKPQSERAPLVHFERLVEELRPGDVLLVEGHTRISDIIKLITQSPWTHSALYVGRLWDINDSELRAHIARHCEVEAHEPLLIEALIGQGTVINPLTEYRHEHLRICRPRGLSRMDAWRVIRHAANRLGHDYDVRHLLDLARFLFPYSILPRRWRSTLFVLAPGHAKRTICSSMLAEAFDAVHFPVLPIVQRLDNGKLRFYKRNTRLYTPQDFDFSPYFDVIKHPLFGLEELAAYRNLPWVHGTMVHTEYDVGSQPQPTTPQTPARTTRSSALNWLAGVFRLNSKTDG